MGDSPTRAVQNEDNEMRDYVVTVGYEKVYEGTYDGESPNRDHAVQWVMDVEDVRGEIVDVVVSGVEPPYAVEITARNTHKGLYRAKDANHAADKALDEVSKTFGVPKFDITPIEVKIDGE